jgi:hypothetical protein
MKRASEIRCLTCRQDHSAALCKASIQTKFGSNCQQRDAKKIAL